MNSDSDDVVGGDMPDGDERRARPGRGRARGAGDERFDDAGGTDDSEDGASLPRLVREELEPATVGAGVPAGSARAAARASAARTATSPTKGRPTPSRDRGPRRGNILLRIARYLREVVGEMRKVIWPTRNEMVTYSIVVVLFLVFMIALTWSLDLGFARAVLAIFG